MQALRQFSIPLKGINIGKHNYVFQIEKSFFSEFEASPIFNGNLECHLNLDKKHDHIILDFVTKGTIETECDRCTALINLPIEANYDCIVKYSESEGEDGDIIFILPESHELNVASLIYEQIIMAQPLIKVYDFEEDDPRPCNESVLSILSEKSETSASSLADALKNFKPDKN